MNRATKNGWRIILFVIALAFASFTAEAAHTGTIIYFNIENTGAPLIQFVSPTPNNGNYNNNQTINVSVIDSDIDTIQIYLNGSVVQTCHSSPCSYMITGEGTFTFHATANDTTSNTSTTATRTITIQKTSTQQTPAGAGGGGGGGIGTTSNETQECIENWVCEEWTECMLNSQTRDCVEVNNCGTDYYKPFTQTMCVVHCETNWSCTDWSACTPAGDQSRTCTDGNACGTTQGKPSDTQHCSYDFCHDGLQNNNEEGMDCGGNCSECIDKVTDANQDKTKQDFITGEAITEHSQDTPNILYTLSLLIVLVVLIAMIPLHRSNMLNDKYDSQDKPQEENNKNKHRKE